MDASPLIGARTGVGVFVAGLIEALRSRDDVEVAEYTVSVGARRAGTVQGVWVPMPARIAPVIWQRGRMPIERFTGQVDVVHGTNYVVPASRARRVVSVYDLSYVHDADVVPRNVAGFDRIVGAAVRSGAAVHTMSEHVADELRARYGVTDISVVAGGLSPALLAAPVRSGRVSGPPAVLSLGTTTRRKRVPLLIEAFSSLTTDAQLRIVGPAGDDEPAVGAALERLPDPVRARVHRVGRVDDAVRDHELRTAAVLAFASEYEGFGFPVLEAMAVGTPVVTTLGGSLAEVAGDAAVVVDGDASSLADGIAQVLGDHELGQHLAQRGRARASTFTWSAAVDAMLECYGG